jgi:hypothetical protein
VNQNLFTFGLEPLSNLLLPINAFLYRLNLIVGQPFDLIRVELSQINRLNYELLTLDTYERAGSSPGLISGFLLCFPFPLNVTFAFGYCLLLARMFNGVIDRMPFAPSTLGLFLINWVTLFLFESPIDLLTILDEANLLTFLFIYLFFKLRRHKIVSSIAT